MEFSIEAINAIIDEADITRDQRISYKEFLALWDEEQEDRRAKALKSVVKSRYNTQSTRGSAPSLTETLNGSDGSEASEKL